MFPLFPLKVENIKVDVYEERQKSPLAIIFYSVSQNKWESGNTGNGAAFLPRKDKVMNEKITELLRLIKENSDLPILPMVDGEICAGDDYGYWSGSWGTARVDEFLISKHNDSIHFKSDDDVFDVLERNLTDEEFEKLPETESECRPYFDALPWKKAIIVFIEMPDEEVLNG